MRYYAIRITDPSGLLWVPPSLQGTQLDGGTIGASFASYTNNQSIPAAWDIEMDIPVIGAATSQGFSSLEIWGVSVAEISQATNLAGNLSKGQSPYNIAVYGGMKKGLPLANPAQAGLLAQGPIFQSFGNWIGTEQTLNFVIQPGGLATPSNVGGIGTLAAPKNLNIVWPAGQPMSTAIRNCLQTAFPGPPKPTITINISPNLVNDAFDQQPCPTLEQFSQYWLRQSKRLIMTPGYIGVQVIPAGNSFLVYDNSASSSGPVKMINFQDLIGQPTWIDSPLISIKCVMRSDLKVYDSIKLPPTIVTNTAAALPSQSNQKSAFQGTFTIISLRHVGRFRQPSADAWVTVIEAVPNTMTS